MEAQLRESSACKDLAGGDDVRSRLNGRVGPQRRDEKFPLVVLRMQGSDEGRRGPSGSSSRLVNPVSLGTAHNASLTKFSCVMLEPCKSRNRQEAGGRPWPARVPRYPRHDRRRDLGVGSNLQLAKVEKKEAWSSEC